MGVIPCFRSVPLEFRWRMHEYDDDVARVSACSYVTAKTI